MQEKWNHMYGHVKTMTVGQRIQITYLKKKLMTFISSYFSMLKFCCDYFIAKDFYLTIILFHVITALYFKIFKGSGNVISSIFFRENFQQKVLINFNFTTISNLKMISIKMSMRFNVFYQNFVMTNLLLTLVRFCSFLTPWSLSCY